MISDDVHIPIDNKQFDVKYIHSVNANMSMLITQNDTLQCTVTMQLDN